MELNKTILAWFTALVGVLAIFAIKSIFEDDNSKIISKKGSKILADEEEMKKLNEKFKISDEENQHQEIFI